MGRKQGAGRATTARRKATTKRRTRSSTKSAAALGITPRERAIFERSPLGIVASDLDRIVRYANPEAMRIFGTRHYENLSLNDFFQDTGSRGKLDTQLKQRRKGYIGTYRARVRRASGDGEVPVDITGLPLTDRNGKVVGALGLFKNVETEEATHDIQRLNGEIQDGHGLLLGVTRRLCETLLPAEAVVVGRYSRNHMHSNPFFFYRHGQARNSVDWSKRWIALTSAQQRDIQTGEMRLVPDLAAFLKDEAVWSELQKDSFVQGLLQEGYRAVLSRPVRRRGKVVGTISLFNRTAAAFTKAHMRLLEELPIDATVLHAIDHEVQHQQAGRFKLLQNLTRCREVGEACEVLVRGLVEIFGWSHVSIFRVDRVRRRVRLVAQHSPRGTAVALSAGYEQGIDEGILGRVVAKKKFEHIADVTTDPDYIPGVKGTVVRSELSWPIIWGDVRHVHWIINVEDTQANAFSEDESAWLGEVAGEVGSLLESIGTLQFLAECFRHTSEPTVVTDVNFEIKKANPAAADLLGVADPKEIRGALAELFLDKQSFAQAIEDSDATFSGYMCRCDDPQTRLPVHVSREDLPEHLGGSIFTIKDLRQIRRNVELELLEMATYEVAIQTNTPLALAVAEIERLAARQADSQREGFDRALRQLGRVKRAFMRLAMFNPNARPASGEFSKLDLATELDAARSSLPEDEQSLVRVSGDQSSATVQGDPFQISFVLETLLSALVRFAPEDHPVAAELRRANGSVEVRLAGYVPTSSTDPAEGRDWSERRTDLRIAQPLVEQFMGNHGGELAIHSLDDGRREFLLRFPTQAPT
ncbi:MAG: GAF domain-containing protein [Betaproteobacteria bacterium]|nr:GAF domain-containing protein [Betaproteobacteria bacterium]